MAYVMKIKYEDTLRRCTFENKPSLADLSFMKLDARVRDLFKFSPGTEIRLTYVDKDGDVITMADDQDLLDAIHLQSLNPLRLSVAVVKPTILSIGADATSGLGRAGEIYRNQQRLNQTFATWLGSGQNSVQKDLHPEGVGREAAKMPHSLQDRPPYGWSGILKPSLTDSFSSGSARTRPLTKPVSALLKPQTAPTPPEPRAVDAGMTLFKRDHHDAAESENGSRIFHLHVQCDVCGIMPIAGPRFKSILKHDYDLCQNCFQKAGSPADYTRIDRPLLRPRHLHSVSSGRMRCPALNANYHSGRYSSVGGPYGGRSEGRSHQGAVQSTAGPYGGKLDARFVMDVTILDGTVMIPRSPFTKIWRLRNSGTVCWEPKTKLVHVGGDDLGSVHSVTLELPENGLAPAQEVEVALNLISPEKPGRYVSHWRLALPTGPKFGHRVWVLIQVVPAEDVRVEAKQNEEPIVDMPVDESSSAAPGKQDVEDDVHMLPVEEVDVQLSSLPEEREDRKRHEEDAVEMPLGEGIGFANLINLQEPSSSLSRKEFVKASHEALSTTERKHEQMSRAEEAKKNLARWDALENIQKSSECERELVKAGPKCVDLEELLSGLAVADVEIDTDVQHKCPPVGSVALNTAPFAVPATPVAIPSPLRSPPTSPSPSPPPSPPPFPSRSPAPSQDPFPAPAPSAGPPALFVFDSEENVDEEVSPDNNVMREDAMSVESGELGGGFSLVEMPSNITDSRGSSATSTPKAEPTASLQAFQLGEEEKFVDEFGTTDVEQINPEALSEKLEAMGFGNRQLNVELLVKNKLDLRRTLDDLFAAAEWDPILEELEEMGFYNSDLNRRLMFKNNGSVKRVVKELVQLYKKPTEKVEKGKQVVGI